MTLNVVISTLSCCHFDIKCRHFNIKCCHFDIVMLSFWHCHVVIFIIMLSFWHQHFVILILVFCHFDISILTLAFCHFDISILSFWHQHVVILTLLCCYYSVYLSSFSCNCYNNIFDIKPLSHYSFVIKFFFYASSVPLWCHSIVISIIMALAFSHPDLILIITVMSLCCQCDVIWPWNSVKISENYHGSMP